MNPITENLKIIIIFFILPLTLDAQVEVNTIIKITNIESSYPFWSPDGSQIVFQSDRNDDDSEIYIMNADGTGIKRLTNSPGPDQTPVWSPDGSRIVFQSFRDGNAELYSMTPEGDNLVNLTNHHSEDSHPKFSHDGLKIIFDSDRESLQSNWEIYEMNLDGTSLDRKTDYENWDTYASISPDGSKILWRRVTGSTDLDSPERNSEIFIMDRNGTDAINISNNPAFDGWPSWSPDGDLIAFASDRQRKEYYDIYIMTPTGNYVRKITSSSKDGYFTKPIWFRDGNGSKIVCTRTKDGNVEIFIIEL